MSLSKPFYRIYRPKIKEDDNLYMHDTRYVEQPGHYIKVVEMLYSDLKILFDYVEPADSNEGCFSFRLHGLLIRICNEIESNFKEIIDKNQYSKSSDLCMHDYFKVNTSHHLSSYTVTIPYWFGYNKVRCPFEVWHNKTIYEKVPWYKAYNNVKHNRLINFNEANLKNVIDAFCGLLVLLSAQFFNDDFAKTDIAHAYGFSVLYDGLIEAIGCPFRIKFPEDWLDEEKYDFKWEDIKDTNEPFEKYNYDNIR